MASNGKDTNAAKPKLVDVLTRMNKEGMSEAELKVIQAMLNKFGKYEKGSMSGSGSNPERNASKRLFLSL